MPAFHPGLRQLTLNRIPFRRPQMKKLMLLVVTFTILAGASIPKRRTLLEPGREHFRQARDSAPCSRSTKPDGGGWSAIFYTTTSTRYPTAWQYPPSPCRNRPSNFRCQHINVQLRGKAQPRLTGTSITGTWTPKQLITSSGSPAGDKKRPSGKPTRPHTPCSSSW